MPFTFHYDAIISSPLYTLSFHFRISFLSHTADYCHSFLHIFISLLFSDYGFSYAAADFHYFSCHFRQIRHLSPD